MLGTAHILMIRHGLYASLPHRRGEGVGNVTDRKQELRRQLRVVRRNPNLIAALFLLQTGHRLDFTAVRELHRERARLHTRRLAAQAQEPHRPTSKSVIQSEAKDLRRVRLGRPVRERPKEANPAARVKGGTLLARGNTLP